MPEIMDIKAEVNKAIDECVRERFSKAGRWIENDKPGWKGTAICSECGTYMLETESGLRSPFIDVMRYCPMCGARMKGE